MTRKADLPSSHGTGIAAVLGLGAVVVILAGAAFLIFRGFNSPETGANALTPTPGNIAANPTVAASLPQVIDPTVPPDPIASPAPNPSPARPERTLRPEPTERPTPTPSPEPVGQETRWSCEDVSILDASRGTWRIQRVNWSDRGRFDQLTLTLVRENGRAPRPGTTALLEWVQPRRVGIRFGFVQPSSNRALAVSFDGPVVIRQGIQVDDMDGVDTAASIQIDMDEDTARVIVGVNGDGCARMAAPEWVRGSSAGEAFLTIDVRH
jgi:hypothetical protein